MLNQLKLVEQLNITNITHYDQLEQITLMRICNKYSVQIARDTFPNHFQCKSIFGIINHKRKERAFENFPSSIL